MQKSLNPISSNNKNYNNYARTAKTFYINNNKRQSMNSCYD